MDKKKIVIVEDGYLLAKNIQKQLEKKGINVLSIEDEGETFISNIRSASYSPDLVLMDVQLAGDLDGFETAYELRKLSDVPVIFMTAYTDRISFFHIESFKDCDFLIKPFPFQELYTKISLIFRAIERRKILNKKSLI